jgi:hypothetical protein
VSCLLALDDVMSLKLKRTEWGIFTAAPGGSGEGCSGLTRAFLCMLKIQFESKFELVRRSNIVRRESNGTGDDGNCARSSCRYDGQSSGKCLDKYSISCGQINGQR